MLTPNSALQLPQTSFRPVVTIYKEITCAPFESMRATHNGLRGFLKNQAHLRQLMLFASLVDAFCLVRAQLETFRASSAEDFGSLRKPDGTNFWTHGGKRNHAKERFAE